MRALAALLTLAACGGGAPHVQSIAMDYGLGCSPDPAPGVEPLVMARANRTVGLRFSLRSGGDTLALDPGTELSLYLVEAGESVDTDGPASGSGIVNAAGDVRVDWGPTSTLNVAGGTERKGLSLLVDGFAPTGLIDVDIQRPHADRRDIVCAYAATPAGLRLDEVRNGESVLLRARGHELGVGARIAFEIDGRTLGDSELDPDGWAELSTTLDLSGVGQAPLLAVATLPSESGFVRERPLPVTVR